MRSKHLAWSRICNNLPSKCGYKTIKNLLPHLHVLTNLGKGNIFGLSGIQCTFLLELDLTWPESWPPGLSGPDNTASAYKTSFLFLELPEQLQKLCPWMDSSKGWVVPNWISIFWGLPNWTGQVPEKPRLIRHGQRKRMDWMTSKRSLPTQTLILWFCRNTKLKTGI